MNNSDLNLGVSFDSAVSQSSINELQLSPRNSTVSKDSPGTPQQKRWSGGWNIKSLMGYSDASSSQSPKPLKSLNARSHFSYSETRKVSPGEKKVRATVADILLTTSEGQDLIVSKLMEQRRRARSRRKFDNVVFQELSLPCIERYVQALPKPSRSLSTIVNRHASSDGSESILTKTFLLRIRAGLPNPAAVEAFDLKVARYKDPKFLIAYAKELHPQDKTFYELAVASTLDFYRDDSSLCRKHLLGLRKAAEMPELQAFIDELVVTCGRYAIYGSYMQKVAYKAPDGIEPQAYLLRLADLEWKHYKSIRFVSFVIQEEVIKGDDIRSAGRLGLTGVALTHRTLSRFLNGYGTEVSKGMIKQFSAVLPEAILAAARVAFQQELPKELRALLCILRREIDGVKKGHGTYFVSLMVMKLWYNAMKKVVGRLSEKDLPKEHREAIRVFFAVLDHLSEEPLPGAKVDSVRLPSWCGKLQAEFTSYIDQVTAS